MGRRRRGYRCSDYSLFRLNLILVCSCIAFYLINNRFLKELTGSLFFKNHFNDLLGGVLIVAFSNGIILWSNRQDLYMNKLIMILTFTFIVGMYWEYVAPLYNKSSVSDPLDVVAYISGGVLYWGIMRMRASRLFR